MATRIKYKKGLTLISKEGREITIINRASGNKHWNCKCGRKNHKIHEGTLDKFYSEV